MQQQLVILPIFIQELAFLQLLILKDFQVYLQSIRQEQQA